MTNLEYLINKEEIHEGYSICRAAYYCKHGKKDCVEIRCKDCEFHSNFKHCVEVLLSEHKIELTKKEKAILESLEDKYDLIARSNFGDLNAFDSILECHIKDNSFVYEATYVNLSAFNHLFKFIPPNGEPMLIKQLLTESEII